MLEILFVWWLSKQVGEIVERKGHSSGLYKLLLVALWFGGEITGAVVGIVLAAGLSTGGEEDSSFFVIYVCALLGAAAGAGITFMIANSLAPVQRGSSRYGRSRLEEQDNLDYVGPAERGYRPPDDRHVTPTPERRSRS